MIHNLHSRLQSLRIGLKWNVVDNLTKFLLSPMGRSYNWTFQCHECRCRVFGRMHLLPIPSMIHVTAFCYSECTPLIIFKHLLAIDVKLKDSLGFANSRMTLPASQIQTVLPTSITNGFMIKVHHAIILVCFRDISCFKAKMIFRTNWVVVSSKYLMLCYTSTSSRFGC